MAKGAAIDSLETSAITTEELEQKINNLRISKDNTTQPIEPLFKNKEDYKQFKERHNKAKIGKKDLKNF